MVRVVVLAALALAATAVPAEAACSAPAAPACVSNTAPFATDDEATSCYNDFQTYYAAMKAHDTCLEAEIDAFVQGQQRASDSGWAAYSQALDAYNRRSGT